MFSCHLLHFSFIVLKHGSPQLYTTWYQVMPATRHMELPSSHPPFNKRVIQLGKASGFPPERPPLARGVWTGGVLHRDRCASPDRSPWLLLFEHQTAFQGDGQWIMSQQRNPYSRFFWKKISLTELQPFQWCFLKTERYTQKIIPYSSVVHKLNFALANKLENKAKQPVCRSPAFLQLLHN